jgi:hypothetical protein
METSEDPVTYSTYWPALKLTLNAQATGVGTWTVIAPLIQTQGTSHYDTRLSH